MAQAAVAVEPREIKTDSNDEVISDIRIIRTLLANNDILASCENLLQGMKDAGLVNKTTKAVKQDKDSVISLKAGTPFKKVSAAFDRFAGGASIPCGDSPMSRRSLELESAGGHVRIKLSDRAFNTGF